MNDNTKNNFLNLTDQSSLKSGLTVPEGYFENFENKLFQNKEINITTPTSFQIPEGYFEDFEKNVFEKIDINSSPKKKVIAFRKRIIQITSTAVAASILLFLGYINLPSNNNSLDFNNITSDDLVNWYEDGYINTEHDDFLLAINTSDTDFESETLNTLTITNDYLEEFINQIDDDSTIINEIE